MNPSTPHILPILPERIQLSDGLTFECAGVQYKLIRKIGEGGFGTVFLIENNIMSPSSICDEIMKLANQN